MAPRSFWKGYLKLSLVTCPVAMTPATTESEKVHVHTLNRKTGNRVVSEHVDAETGKRVERVMKSKAIRGMKTVTSFLRTMSSSR
jgi:DNA end-binding protein Ku